MDTNLVPLVTVAAEIGVTPDELVAKLDPNSVLANTIGLRCLEQSTAARLIDEHRAAVARKKQRDASRKERLAEVARRAKSTLRGGVPTTCDDPLADLLAVDGDPRLEEAGTRLEAWLSGRSTAGRYIPTKAD